MSDNQDKSQTQTISVEGFKDCGTPIQHKKKQLPVRYHTTNIKNDNDDGGPDLIQVEAYTMQYDIKVNNIRPVNEAKSIYETTNELIYEKLSEGGREVDNIELVNDSDEKELWIADLRLMGFKAAISKEVIPNDVLISKNAVLNEKWTPFYFCDGSLEAGDKVIIGSYDNPDDYREIELIRRFSNESGYQWSFNLIEGDA